jgi:hypothetical protein
MRIAPQFDADRIRAIADEFRDYWVAVPGSKGCKLDWLATWRNWVRKEVKAANARSRGRSFESADRDEWGIPR